MVGFGDVAFNARRKMLGSIPIHGKVAYHMRSVEYSGKRGSYSVQLLRKSKWPKQHITTESK